MTCLDDTFPVLSRQQRGTRYGTQRLWGAAGYGLSTFASGFVYDNTTGGYGGVVIVFVAVSAAALVAALGVRFDGDRSSAGSQDGEELQRFVKGCH